MYIMKYEYSDTLFSIGYSRDIDEFSPCQYFIVWDSFD